MTVRRGSIDDQREVVRQALDLGADRRIREARRGVAHRAMGRARGQHTRDTGPVVGADVGDGDREHDGLAGVRDPVAVAIGPLKIRWYGLMYLIGFAIAWFLARSRAKRPEFGWKIEWVDDLIFYAALGLILGARIGYMLFYGADTWTRDPVAILKVWEGGMSFHGGMLGVILAVGVVFILYYAPIDIIRGVSAGPHAIAVAAATPRRPCERIRTRSSIRLSTIPASHAASSDNCSINRSVAPTTLAIQ